MNLTFSKALLLSATAAMFFNVPAHATGQEPNLKSKTRAEFGPTTLKVTNYSSATNFHFQAKAVEHYRDGDYVKKQDGETHLNLKKGSVVEEVLPFSETRWNEYHLSIYVWDPEKKPWGDNVIDATNGGFNITKSLGDSEIRWGISDCTLPDGKDSYCAGPEH